MPCDVTDGASRPRIEDLPVGRAHDLSLLIWRNFPGTPFPRSAGFGLQRNGDHSTRNNECGATAATLSRAAAQIAVLDTLNAEAARGGARLAVTPAQMPLCLIIKDMVR